jgi:hypothetical protein
MISFPRGCPEFKGTVRPVGSPLAGAPADTSAVNSASDRADLPLKFVSTRRDWPALLRLMGLLVLGCAAGLGPVATTTLAAEKTAEKTEKKTAPKKKAAPEPAEPAIPNPEPTEEFREYVRKLRIDGVVPGTKPTIYAQRRTIHLGQSVDATLGIVFRAMDSDAHIIVFEDKTGARLQKKY